MRSRGGLLLLLLTVLLGVLFVISGGKGVGASGSSLSRGATGWLAAAQAVSNLGGGVLRLDRPLEAGELDPGEDLLVMVLPWQRPGPEALIAARAHLRAGGHLLIGYSGGTLAPGEDELLSGLAVATARRELDRLPLAPLAWRREASRPRHLRHGARVAGGDPLRVPPLDRGPVAPGSGLRWRVLFEDESGQPASVRWRHPLGGTLWLIPSSLLSNAWLAQGGNARFLVELVDTLPQRWVIDEYHHGLLSPAVRRQQPGRRALGVLIAQLGVLYLLAVWALARRWAPVWPSVATVSSSHEEFLLAVGRLHRRLGHHRDGARALIERVEEAQPGLRVPAALRRRADSLEPGELTDLAREITLLQTRGGSVNRTTDTGFQGEENGP